MASPKTTISSPPIVFTSRVVKPDVILEVLGQEYHVMSPALKMHSAFFAAFLDASNKGPTTPGIQSSSIIGLALLVLRNRMRRIKLEGDAKLQIEGFQILMCAIHSTPFTIAIDGIEELDTATTLADYYRALPILSTAVSAVLFSRPDLLFEIPKYCLRLLSISKKLRIAVLFHECLIFACGPWNDPINLTLPEGPLRAICVEAHGIISIETATAHKKLLESISTHDEVGTAMVAAAKNAWRVLRYFFLITIGTFFTKLRHVPKMSLAIAPLMRNALTLEWSPSLPGMYYMRDIASYRVYFNSLDISNKSAE
ncbi:hypothetical protein LSUB1_G004582 [Lachnellula subtilissima]|uniref:BTB domain-containing protein n=1 Tax=Lachnellula subtilissima TaxID=602034 RepID=A0A8H8RNU7_9HELO|nr:hypothetical protein LSUB1_G004582 [Lachnellula subtilissima]